MLIFGPNVIWLSENISWTFFVRLYCYFFVRVIVDVCMWYKIYTFILFIVWFLLFIHTLQWTVIFYLSLLLFRGLRLIIHYDVITTLKRDVYTAAETDVIEGGVIKTVYIRATVGGFLPEWFSEKWQKNK